MFETVDDIIEYYSDKEVKKWKSHDWMKLKIIKTL